MASLCLPRKNPWDVAWHAPKKARNEVRGPMQSSGKVDVIHFQTLLSVCEGNLEFVFDRLAGCTAQQKVHTVVASID